MHIPTAPNAEPAVDMIAAALEFKLANLLSVVPVTPSFAGRIVLPGTSLGSRVRNVGELAAPEIGPAKTVFAFSLASVTASVPLFTIGEPPTLNIAGIVRA